MVQRGTIKARDVALIFLTACGLVLFFRERRGLANLSFGQSGRPRDDFDVAASMAYTKILDQERARLNNSTGRQDFSLEQWTQQTGGGLTDEDRVLLAELYRRANSVFEYGLGESTYIANEVGVPRYAGIDSDVRWVDETRKKVAGHFRFYYADVGDVKAWGYPADPELAKSVWQYQVAPLQAELKAFDVYMVDGRFRIPCVFLSFLHASSRGANPKDTIVLLHDCYIEGQSDKRHSRLKRHYDVVGDILELVDHSTQLLCVYKRKETTTDDMLLASFRRYQDDWS